MARPKNTPSLIRKAMLQWYDSHARILPWRSLPHERPNPYHVWLSEVMLQQTTVQAVIPYFGKFVTLWPRIEDLAAASVDDVLREWAGLGYYSRARNLHKCACVVVAEYGGQFPQGIKRLKILPGIGDYTAAAIASIAYDIPATVIDGNVERVVARLYRIETPLPEGKKDIRVKAEPLFVGDNQDRPSCFAQSLMDLGAGICTPKSPKCGLCPIADYCEARKEQEVERYPKRKKKEKIPEKHAIVYLYVHDGQIGVEKRPEKGMLGGMVGFPTSEWILADKKLEGVWREDMKIRHVFTHFALTLYPVILHQKTKTMISISDIDRIGLPTLFQKVWNMVRSEL